MINESVKWVIDSKLWSIRPQVLLEASLNRILKHIGGGEIVAKDGRVVSGGGHFAILTAWRKFGDRTRKPEVASRDVALQGQKSPQRANRENFANLVREIRSHHLGCIRLTGSWLDSDGDQLSDPIERSIFVPGSVPARDPGALPKTNENDQGAGELTRDLIINLGQKYNQDSVIYSGPETKGKIELWGIDKNDPTSVRNQEFKLQMSWESAGLHNGAEIQKQLETQKLKMARVENTKKQGLEPDPKDAEWSAAGATQVGNQGRKVNPAKAAIKFESVYESLGVKPCNIGVTWMWTNEDPGLAGMYGFLSGDTLATQEDWKPLAGASGCLIH